MCSECALAIGATQRDRFDLTQCASTHKMSNRLIISSLNGQSLVHSFMSNIYIAPLQEKYSEVHRSVSLIWPRGLLSYYRPFFQFLKSSIFDTGYIDAHFVFIECCA